MLVSSGRISSSTILSSLANDDGDCISYKEQEKAPKKIGSYVLGALIGEGAYSKVKEAIDIRTLRRVAVKIINSRKMKKPALKQQLKTEIAILKKLRSHKNILKLVDVIQLEEKQKTYIVMEYSGVGSVHDLIESACGKKLPLSDVWHFFTQLVDGIEELHNQGIIHHDIKPANMLVMSDGTVKIADFGTSCELDQFSANDIVEQSQGTAYFQSPQIASGEPIISGFKADIWAAGVSLYVLATGKFPFEANNIIDVYDKIAIGKFDIPAHVDSALADLIRGMLEKNEEKRFSIQEIKSSAWFVANPYEDVPRFNLEFFKRSSRPSSTLIADIVCSMEVVSNP